MKVKTALATMIQWSVNRLGPPGLDTNLPRRMVGVPALAIPDEIHDPVLRRTVATLRYPINIKTDLDIGHVWQAYESTIEHFSNLRQLDMRTGDVAKHFCERLLLPKWVTQHLFEIPPDARNQMQLGMFALVVARVTHELFGGKLVDEPGRFVSHIGPRPAFGVIDGKVASRFHPDIPVAMAAASIALESQPRRVFDVGSAAVLNLYRRAEDCGDITTVYWLDCAVWASQSQSLLLHRDLNDYVALRAALARGRKSEVDKVLSDRQRTTRKRLPLTDEWYHQGMYIIDHAENPKRTLYDLLVPHVIPAKVYIRDFAYAFDKTLSTSDIVRSRMAASLQKLYESQKK